MIQTFQATDALKSSIDYIWIIEAEHLSSTNRQDIIMPLGHINIIFNFKSPYYFIDTKKRVLIPDSAVIGQIKRAKHVQYGENLYQVGISMTPLGYIQSFNYPISQLTERICSVSDVFPEMKQLRKKIIDAQNHDLLITAINQYFLGKVNSNALETCDKNHMISYVKQHCSNLNVSHMASYFGISISTLERTFKRYVGLPPKVYGDILKFQQNLMNTQLHTDIYEQYYDQSHFIKTCKKFSGKTVNELENSIEELTLNFMLRRNNRS
ncbi:AraC-like DNA-binding protein [Paenibacillus sp. JGP012]|uniref:helix-turn-helix domain-containing protein n=1 Tax=Paenibacillus sp. JGP012 TaxID=2735914 RepID=UPI00160CE30B|nr:helix-turn-helix domain-containing protein [Paenibacillus sp. JGP012]MBB6022422.1 AraC-like DNA-binding protein [Paenibacillus sp. JGP012]